MAKWKRTPQQTRQVKNIVDSIKKHYKRLKNKGIEVDEPNWKNFNQKHIFKFIESTENPEATFDYLIGTKNEPGVLRQAMPSYADPDYRKRKQYTLIDTPKGIKSPVEIKIVEARNKAKNWRRKNRSKRLKEKKKEEWQKPENMDDDEYNGVIDGLTYQGGPLNEETLPEDYDFDFDEYEQGFYNESNLDHYIEAYEEAFMEYGFMPSFSPVLNAIETLRKHNPSFLLDIFESGDNEADVDYLYELYKLLWKKNARTGKRTYANEYIAGYQRIERYWTQKANEGLAEVGIDTTGYVY